MDAMERAKEVCRKANLPESGVVYSLVYSALKVQDRETRHSCAEAVMTLPDHNKYTDSDGNQWVGLNAAHAVCMNVNAV